MRIQKNSDIGTAPDWFLSAGVDDNDVKNAAGVAQDMTREDVIAAKTEIDRCAEAGDNFFVHEDLDSSVKDELNEYAQVAGLSSDDIKQVTATQQEAYTAVNDLSSINQEQEAVPTSDPLFDISPTEPTDPGVFSQNNDWDNKTVVSKMEQRPDPDSSVVPIRGADSVETSRIVGTRPGENSLVDPNAIGDLDKSEAQSTRQQIVSGNEERRADIAFDKMNWEAEAISGLSESEAVRDGIRRTESPVSQNHSSASQYANTISPEGRADMPDQTMGETLSERNSQKRAEIQRSKEDGREWDDPQSSVPEKVSDVFSDTLEKLLNKDK